MAYARVKIMKTGIIPMTQSGAILGRPGQYKSPPFLMMPGNPVIEEVTLYDFQVNEIPEPEDLNNIPEDYGKELVVVSQRTAKAYTYYCNLDADAGWDDTPMWNSSSTTSEKKACLEARNMTGDGSRENPWKNLTYALEQLQCFVTAQCCHYVRIVCTGTAHYTVCAYDLLSNGYYYYDRLYFYNRLIIDGANVDVPRQNDSVYTDIYGFYSQQCIYYNCTAKMTGNNYNNTNGFSGSGNIYYNCTAEVTATGTYNKNAYGFSTGGTTFYRCTATVTMNADGSSCRGKGLTGTTFYGCTATVTINGGSGIGFEGTTFYGCTATVNGEQETYDTVDGFEGNSRSKFYNCIAMMNGNQNSASRDATGFHGNVSKFYNCIAVGTSHGSVYGFHGNQGIYYNCTATVTMTNSDGGSNCYGFRDTAGSSLFYVCTAKADANMHSTKHDWYGYSVYCHGFTGNTFYACTATVTVTAAGTEKCDKLSAYAYGFYSYNSCLFENCTYSVSAVANAAPSSDGSFMEYEYECGIYCDGECQAGYRCERRTEEGMETC